MGLAPSLPAHPAAQWASCQEPEADVLQQRGGCHAVLACPLDGLLCCPAGGRVPHRLLAQEESKYWPQCSGPWSEESSSPALVSLFMM